MTIEQLYRASAGNSYNIKELLDRKYRDVIRNQATRLLGHTSTELVDHVLQQTQLRLFEVAMDCDVYFLIFDCLRKEIFRQLQELHGMSDSSPNPILREYIPHKENIDGSHRLDIALALMSGQQREYFFNRYYFLISDVPYNKRFEKRIGGLFAGKGMAVHRFRYFHITALPVTPSLYLDCLSDLDPFYISRLENVRSQARFVKASGPPIEMLYIERLMRRFEYILRLLPILFLLAIFFFILLFFSLEKWL